MYETMGQQSRSLGAQAQAQGQDASEGHLATLNYRLSTLAKDMGVLRDRLASVNVKLYGEGPTVGQKTGEKLTPVPNGRLASLRSDLEEIERLVADCHSIADGLQALS